MPTGRGAGDYILNNDQTTLQASRLRCWRRFSKLLVVTSIYVIDTKMRLTFPALENQDDFSFEDFVICPEDHWSRLELMMDRNNEFDKYQREVDENRGDYKEKNSISFILHTTVKLHDKFYNIISNNSLIHTIYYESLWFLM
jgi:hypothetical protein